MAPAVLVKSPAAVKPSPVAKTAPVYHGPISARGISTGVVAKVIAPADEAKLVVLNSVGEVVSEVTRPVTDSTLVNLSYSPSLIAKAGKEPYFIVVKGYLKGTLVWEQRLGRTVFHS